MTLTQTKEGLILPLKVTPKARENKIVGWENDVLKVRVTAAPENGAANQSVIVLLAKTLHIPQRDVILLHGSTSRLKQFCIVGLTETEIFTLIPH